MPDDCEALIEFYREFIDVADKLFKKADESFDRNKQDGIWDLRWNTSLTLCEHLLKLGCDTAEVKAISGSDCEDYRKWEKEEDE